MKPSADWHRESWNRCLRTELPQLIGQHCDLSTYRVTRHGNTATVVVGVLNGDQELATQYPHIPIPDVHGVFQIYETPMVVVPLARDERMEDVRCAGEQLHAFLAERIVPCSPGLVDTETALRAWLPLDEWTAEFFREIGQPLDTRNWLSRATHLRRIRLEAPQDICAEEQLGKVCPYETPEGPWIGRVLTIAVGARIEDGRVVAADAGSSGSGLGAAASYVPYLERTDPARALMGCNMMRQWVPPRVSEPALVQTGNEPEVPEFWCGYNLLTAFTPFGRSTYEDGIVVSESAACRMAYPEQPAVGDKLSNRHGQKGVVSAILPDEKMPRLPDGGAVECVVSFIGLHTRLNTGQLWEAATSWLARGRGEPVVVAPYESPTPTELAQALDEAGAPHRGMQRLALPDGSRTEREVLVGWVYWGLTVHIAADKLRAGGLDEPVQLHGEMEYNALRNNGLYAYIAETNGPMAEQVADPARALADIRSARWTPGETSTYEAAPLRRIRSRLEAAGIEVCLDSRGLSVGWAAEGGFSLPVAMRHPWISWKTVSGIRENPEDPAWRQVHRLTKRLSSLLDSDAPTTLVGAAKQALQEALDRYFHGLIRHEDVIPRGRRRFTGRGVIVPGAGRSLDQAGIPDEMAWTLFGPLVEPKVGAEDVAARSNRARAALEAEMARRWVIVNRAPTLADSTMIAFRPVRVDHAAVELHPLACRWLSGDFDGDQVGIYLPVSAAAQKETGERISIAGHLTRHPALLETLLPSHEALWGLASLSLRDAGRAELRDMLGADPPTPEGYLTAAGLYEVLRHVLASKGPVETAAIAEALLDAGLAEATRRGASLDLFALSDAGIVPSGDARLRRSEASELIASSTDFGGRLGPQLLAVKSAARGTVDQLVNLTHSRLVAGREASASQLSGLDELAHMRLALDVRRHLDTIVNGIESVAGDYNATQRSSGYNVLARAARTESPGVVFAAAAETGEVDPLTDLDARLTVGLPIEPPRNM
jgi:hypothetical protein